LKDDEDEDEDNDDDVIKIYILSQYFTILYQQELGNLCRSH